MSDLKRKAVEEDDEDEEEKDQETSKHNFALRRSTEGQKNRYKFRGRENGPAWNRFR